jgi:pyruvate decarboxylase
MAYLKVPNDRLKTPLSKLPPPNDPETEKEALDAIVKAVQDADGDAVVLVDVCTIRHYVRDEVTDFFQKTQFPVYTGAATDRLGGVWPADPS